MIFRTFASDEKGDDDIGLSVNINLPVDASGIVKIHTDGSDDTGVSNDDGLDEPYPKAERENGKVLIIWYQFHFVQKWQNWNVVEGLPSVSWSKLSGTMQVYWF